jgi:Taurine catabolism dioxygenase TauD, TfdA family
LAVGWPPGGPPAAEWRLSIAETLPALAGLQTEASDQHRAEALAALDRIGRTAAASLRHGPRLLLVEGLPAVWLANGLVDAFYLHLCKWFGQLDPVRGPFYDVYDRRVVGRDHVRYPDTNLSHGLHTDSMSAASLPDMVGLLCVRQAARGGATRLVNVYNACARLTAENPRALEILREDFPRQTRSIATGQVDPSAVDAYPVLSGSSAAGTLRCRYMRRWIEAGYVCAGIAPPASAVAALDAFDRALETDPAMLCFRMAPAEILFLDNHVILHDRETYQDLDHAPRLMRRAWIYGRDE